jgi:hypothetical protein
MTRLICHVAGDDAPTIIIGGKYEGVPFVDLGLEELVGLRRDQEVSRAAVEHEIWRRRMMKRRARKPRCLGRCRLLLP